MAKGFACFKCGSASLVRSNFKLTTDHRPYCRDEKGCEARAAKEKSDAEVEEVRPREGGDLAV